MYQEAVSADIILNSLIGIFSPKEKEQRHKQLGYTDKLVTTQIWKLKVLGPLSNFKIQQ